MLLNELLEGLKDMFFTFLYRMFSLICNLIDFLKDIFYMMCGIDPVTINGEKTDLLSSLTTSDVIRKSFLMVFIVGVILLIVFTIVAIIRTSYIEKSNIFQVMKKSGQSFILAILIPFIVLASILLTNVVMQSINTAMTPYGTTTHSTIGGEFLSTIGYNSYIGSEDKEIIFSKFVSGELDYTDVDLVKSYFNVSSMNFLIGILGGLVMLIMFVLSSLTFVQRIFDVILLYIISPISISTIPLDDGNRFKLWKDMMIGKILSAYGIILVMNLFFLIIPEVYQINFFSNGFQNGIVYILFLIGGSFAVNKANDIIARLCGSSQGGNELASMVYNVRSAFALTHAVKHSVGGAMGKFIGGNSYQKSRKRGGTRKEALQSSAKSNVNQRKIDPSKQKKQSKLQKALKTPMRLATMPAGMIHDISQGGVIAMGKNFMPRLNNVMHGSSILNHADVSKKPLKDKNAKTEAKGGIKNKDNKKHTKPNQVYRRTDNEKRIKRGKKK